MPVVVMCFSSRVHVRHVCFRLSRVRVSAKGYRFVGVSDGPRHYNDKKKDKRHRKRPTHPFVRALRIMFTSCSGCWSCPLMLCGRCRLFPSGPARRCLITAHACTTNEATGGCASLVATKHSRAMCATICILTTPTRWGDARCCVASWLTSLQVFPMVFCVLCVCVVNAHSVCKVNDMWALLPAATRQFCQLSTLPPSFQWQDYKQTLEWRQGMPRQAAHGQVGQQEVCWAKQNPVEQAQACRTSWEARQGS